MLGYKLLLWIGLALILTQFLGVPSVWKETIVFLSGIILVAESLIARGRIKNFYMKKTIEQDGQE